MHARTLARKRATYRDGRQIKQEAEQFSSVIPHSSDCSSSAAFNRDATFVCVGCWFFTNFAKCSLFCWRPEPTSTSTKRLGLPHSLVCRWYSHLSAWRSWATNFFEELAESVWWIYRSQSQFSQIFYGPNQCSRRQNFTSWLPLLGAPRAPYLLHIWAFLCACVVALVSSLLV